jgi:hypothetical protein
MSFNLSNDDGELTDEDKAFEELEHPQNINQIDALKLAEQSILALKQDIAKYQAVFGIINSLKAVLIFFFKIAISTGIVYLIWKNNESAGLSQNANIINAYLAQNTTFVLTLLAAWFNPSIQDWFELITDAFAKTVKAFHDNKRHPPSD